MIFMDVNITYSGAWGNPVSHSQSRQSYSHRQHHQQFDGSGLLSQARQVLIPDTQQLLLAVRMSHKLKGTDERSRTEELRRRKRENKGYWKLKVESLKCDSIFIYLKQRKAEIHYT